MARKLNHDQRRALAPKPKFGKLVSFSQRHSPRKFKPNLQLVTVNIEGKSVRLYLSARQIRTLNKENSSNKLLNEIKRLI